MGTISSAFSMIAQALEAEQAGLNTVANNVANANTPGYTQETPNWQQNQPIEINGVFYGSGVSNTGATSLRDRVLETRLNQQIQLASSSGSRLTALNTVQALFTPATGSGSGAGNIGIDITGFFGSLSSLEANPTSNPLRQQVLAKATALAGDISGAAASLNAQKAALDQEAASVTSQVNALTGAIAKLNLQIQSNSPNADAGPLEDQRQQDIGQLSNLIGVNQIATENNGLSITTTSGQLLVSEGTSVALTTGTVGGVTHFYTGAADVTGQLSTGGGSLGGYLTARDQDIPNTLASLDQLAYSVTTQVNTLNNTGTDMAGDNGNAGNVFAQPAVVQGSAMTMKVVMTDPNHIAAATLGQGTGDNGNATAMANLGTQSIVGGQTPANFYSNFVTSLGSTVSAVQTDTTAQSASVTQLQAQNNALSGVNLNDEAAAMTTLERSYQAASQVFSLLNTIMANSLNLGEQTTVT